MSASFSRLLWAMVAVGVGLGLVAGRSASAESYPTRPITMIVPFPAGGPADLVGRLVAERMKRALGQPIIVENVGGANGAIGIAKAVRASPDGYTIHIGIWGSHVINGAINPLPFDPVKDIEPVSLLVSLPLLLFARKDLPPEDIRGLIAWLKTNPGKATLGTSTAGTQAVGALFQKVSGTQVRLVPYRGAAPALQDLAAGHIDLGWESSANLPLVCSGAVKAYLVTSKVRLETDPSIPTADEVGLGALTLGTWVALFAKRGTPHEIIEKLNTAAAAALDDPMVQKRFADVALDIVPSEQRSPEFLGSLLRSEIERWWPIVKAENIRGD